MKIYTKTGDKGETGLFDGSRVPKNHPLIAFYGALDELNASLGIARGHLPSKDEKAWLSLKQQLSAIQQHLFEIGADILGKSHYFNPSSTDLLEKWMDEMDASLPPLKNFILPSGSLIASHLHHSRCLCRGVEREYYQLQPIHDLTPSLQAYLNRLSDYLFVAARYGNLLNNEVETPVIFKDEVKKIKN